MSVAGPQLQAERQSAIPAWVRTDSPVRTFLLAVLLLAMTAAIYLPVLSQPFFNVDDNYYFVDNPHVHELDFPTVRWAFGSLDMANWIPLSFLSYAVDWQLFGDNPAGPHAVNVLLHGLTAGLLFWLLKRATGYVGRSFMVAALFALHPMNVEGVAWIAERKTVLSGLFFVLALIAYERYARQPRERRYWFVALLFALGLSAKSQIITLPFVFLLWDYWPLQRMSLNQAPSPEARLAPAPEKRFFWLCLEKIPFLCISAFGAIMTLSSEAGAHARLWAPFSQRLGNAIFSYSQYLAKCFWPMNMTPMYPSRGDSLGTWQIGAAALVLLAITAVVLVGRRHRYLPMGWFWFLGTLVPLIQIFQFSKEGMADRFGYEAFIGIFILICWGVSDWAAQRHVSQAWLAGCGAAALLALMMVTHRQIGYWKDPHTLWTHALEAVPDNWFAEGQVGRDLMLAGKMDEAVPHFRHALALNPNDALSNIGIALYDQQHGEPQEAVAHYETALHDYSLLPHDAAGVYKNMAAEYGAMGDIARQRECLNKAAQLRDR